MEEVLQIYIDNGIDFSMDTGTEITEVTLDSCSDLSKLYCLVKNFTKCDLKKNATNTVFSDGNPNSNIMLIGEAPGVNEDLEGIPFCGASGKLLDKMLAAIDLDRNKVYITNMVFWRPPGNRQPTFNEIEICRPFVEKHISLVSPKLIVLVGGIAATSMLNSDFGISRLRGRFYDYTNQYLGHNSIKAIAIFHPAYLLRQPKQKRLAWEDLKLIKSYLIS